MTRRPGVLTRLGFKVRMSNGLEAPERRLDKSRSLVQLAGPSQYANDVRHDNLIPYQSGWMERSGMNTTGRTVTASMPRCVPDQAGNPNCPDGVYNVYPCSTDPRRLRLGIMQRVRPNDPW